MKTKAQTIIGFAVKANKVVYGADYVEKNRNVRLIICCKTLAANTLERMQRLNKPLIIADLPLEEIVFRKNTKVIGITDTQMSKAITKEYTNNNKDD